MGVGGILTLGFASLFADIAFELAVGATHRFSSLLFLLFDHFVHFLA